MPTTSASKAAVRSVSVEDKQDVRKWVNYSAHYSYKVPGGLPAVVSKSLCSPHPFQQTLLMPRHFTFIVVDESALTLVK